LEVKTKGQQRMKDLEVTELDGKFQNPDLTAKGEERASVPLMKATTLWFNTGTLCNIECVNCYIESSPSNDRLVYITTQEVTDYLDQIKDRNWATTEIAFTGGEPFMNPDMIDITRVCLERGFDVLILTNAMLPMMRKGIKAGLLELKAEFGDKLTLRISLDHFIAENHDAERGKGSYDVTIKGMQWLRDEGFNMAVAGRTVWGDSDADSRAGYAALYETHGFDIDAMNPGNHNRLLGYFEQVTARHHVCILAHGRKTQRCRQTSSFGLYLAALFT